MSTTQDGDDGGGQGVDDARGGGGVRGADERGEPGRRFNRQNFGFSFGLKNRLSFGLRFPTLRKTQKLVV